MRGIKMIVYAVKLKNMGLDENGFTKYIWIIESQKKILESMRNNPEQRYNFVEIDDIVFSPMDIAYIEKKEMKDYELPKYVKERYLKDNNMPLLEH